jgi:hypothetical protein
MLIALMLAVAAALLIAFGVGASGRSSTRDGRDDVEELVVLDIVSDGELDGDFECPDER